MYCRFRRPRGKTVVALAIVAFVWIATPGDADAQLLRKIKQQARQKVDSTRVQVEGRVLETSGRVVDSTVEKTARGVDTVVGRTGAALDAAIEKTEDGVAGLVRAAGGEDPLANELAAGRAVLRDVRFTADGDVDVASAEVLRRLAALLRERPEPYLIESHTADSGDPAADMALAQHRATSLKAWLVGEGVPAARLFAMGVGSSRPLTGADGSTETVDRIEIARMQ